MKLIDHLLLYDLHHGVLDVVGELRLVQPVLEILACRLEVLTRGVGTRAQNLHQATSKVLLVRPIQIFVFLRALSSFLLTRLGRASRRRSNQIA